VHLNLEANAGSGSALIAQWSQLADSTAAAECAQASAPVAAAEAAVMNDAKSRKPKVVNKNE